MNAMQFCSPGARGTEARTVSIRVLDCAPMLPREDVGGTCLVVDTDQGPVLVDTGVGLHDHEHPGWVARLFSLDFDLGRDPETTAVCG